MAQPNDASRFGGIADISSIFEMIFYPCSVTACDL